jgi:hypothetical protein
VTLKLTEADALPLDYEPYADRIVEFTKELERRWPQGIPGLSGVSAAAADMRSAAQGFNQRRSEALAKADRPALNLLNDRLLMVERALLSPDGIPGRPWYRHLVYAPRFTYAPELLPGIAEAMEADDREKQILWKKRSGGRLSCCDDAARHPTAPPCRPSRRPNPLRCSASKGSSRICGFCAGRGPR